MGTKFTAFALALALASGPALAQSTPTGKLPSRKQCEAGWKPGMQWTETQFKDACAKIMTNAKPSTIKK